MGLVIGTGGIHIGTSGGGASPVKRFDAEAEYIKRKAGGTDNIGTGKAKILTLKGKSVVWNQLVSATSSSRTSAGCDAVYDTDGTITITGASTSTSSFAVPNSSSISIIIGHKYLIKGCPNEGSLQTYCLRYNSNGYAETGGGKIVTGGSGSLAGDINQSPVIIVKSAISGGLVFRPQLIDLTQMFGAGNEPSTVEEFERLFPLPYYEYNPGEIINNEAEAIETVGFNQWDEEWEVGSIGGHGEPYNNSESIRSKNYVPVIANQTYFVKRGNSTNKYHISVFFYDVNKNFISFVYTNNESFVIPNECSYLKIATTGSPAYGATYNHDICINLSDPAKNGTYKPYEKHTLQLGLNSFDVKDSGGNIITVNGLKSAGSAYDEIDLTRGKYIKRIGDVDMGTLEWDYAVNHNYSRFAALLNNVYADNWVPVIVNSYGYVASGTPIINNSLNLALAYYNGKVYLRNDAYSDAATFKTAMSGVMLYYELATPIEYDLVTPIGNSYKVISGGTEERLPRDTASSVIAPIKYSVKYVQPKE